MVSLNSGPSFILYYNLKARYLSSFNGKVFRPRTRDIPLQINVLSQQSPLLCLRDPVKLSCVRSDLDITRNLKTTRHSDNIQPPSLSTFNQTPDHRFTGNLLPLGGKINAIFFHASLRRTLSCWRTSLRGNLKECASRDVV